MSGAQPALLAAALAMLGACSLGDTVGVRADEPSAGVDRDDPRIDMRTDADGTETMSVEGHIDLATDRERAAHRLRDAARRSR